MKSIKGKIMAIMAVLIIAGGAFAMGSVTTFGPRSTSAAPVLYSQDAVTSIYDAASPAVVEIIVTQQAGALGRAVQEGQGSGFLVDSQGHILTNNHVVSGATAIKVTLKSGNTVTGKIVGTDTADDLALISIDPAAVAGVTPLQLGPSSMVKPGQMAIAIGNPYGLTESITLGIISGLNRSLGTGLTGMIQTDAAINPGNSGGPLLDINGQVIGINTAIESPSTGARGIGFAVPSDTASRVLPSLLAGQQVTRPWLGISGLALTPNTATTLGLSVNQGVYVVTVVPGSPAEKAGLKAGGTDSTGAPAAGGDVITAADGKAVASVTDLSSYLNTKKVGDTVNLSVLRGGSAITVTVTLGAWPDNLNVTPSTPNIPRNPQLPQPRTPRLPRGHFGD